PFPLRRGSPGRSPDSLPPPPHDSTMNAPVSPAPHSEVAPASAAAPGKLHPSPAVLVLGLLATLSALSVYQLQLRYPLLFDDDFQVMTASWTWADTVANLWAPHNEHTMPSGRLSTWLLIYLAGSASAVANVVWQGPLLVLANMWLAYLFIS